MNRPVQLVADHCNIDMSLEPAPDAMWVRRIIAHAAIITNFAYGTGTNDSQKWDELWSYALSWDKHKPDSFRPMYCSWLGSSNHRQAASSSSSNGCISSLPIIYYTSDCAVAAQQNFQLCRILLLANNPRARALGLGRAQYVESQEDEIRSAVRIICGISKANPEYIPARLTAGLAIAMCGELFAERSETVELLQILSEAELHLGWPCLKVSRTGLLESAGNRKYYTSDLSS